MGIDAVRWRLGCGARCVPAPAVRDDLKVSPDRKVLLFSRSGYSKSLLAVAEADARMQLIDVMHELDVL